MSSLCLVRRNMIHCWTKIWLLTQWPLIFFFFETVFSPNAPAFGSVSLTPVSIRYWSAPPVQAISWYKLRCTCRADIARFQITVLVRFSSVWFSLVTVLLIVCPRSMLCPFHKKKKKKKKKRLRIWWKKPFGFCQTDNQRSSFMMYCYSTDLNVYTWVELTYQNRQVFWIQFLT